MNLTRIQVFEFFFWDTMDEYDFFKAGIHGRPDISRRTGKISFVELGPKILEISDQTRVRTRQVKKSRTWSPICEAVPESLLRRVWNLQYHRFYKLSFKESELSKYFENFAHIVGNGEFWHFFGEFSHFAFLIFYSNWKFSMKKIISFSSVPKSLLG